MAKKVILPTIQLFIRDGRYLYPKNVWNRQKVLKSKIHFGRFFFKQEKEIVYIFKNLIFSFVSYPKQYL